MSEKTCSQMRNGLPSIIKASKLVCDLFRHMIVAQKRPIYIVGLPRTGTTWIASILNTAEGIKYFHEPFNHINVPGAAMHSLKYLRANDDDHAFAWFCRDAFAGRTDGPYVRSKLAWRYRRFPWWPGRVMVKDVHSFGALEWIHRRISPVTVIVIRHPCAVTASWLRLNYRTEWIERFLDQPNLTDDYLKPFEDLLRKAQGDCEKIGTVWGATYYVMLQQKRMYPDWIVVQHEVLCRDPVGEFRELFRMLDLRWTQKTDELITISTTRHGDKPYDLERISSQEPDKWKKELDPQQIQQVRQFVEPFGVKYYADF